MIDKTISADPAFHDAPYSQPLTMAEHYASVRAAGQHEPGAKLDAGKVDMSLLEFLPRAMTEVTRVMSYGQVKYTRGGFLDVPDAYNRYTAAMMRHYFAEKTEGEYDKDPWYDTPKGLAFKGKIMHDAQVAVNALFRLEIKLREKAKK